MLIILTVDTANLLSELILYSFLETQSTLNLFIFHLLFALQVQRLQLALLEMQQAQVHDPPGSWRYTYAHTH